MGSPDNEKGRSEQEGPRHQVTLTQGFWLADAPCTQAVYEAVTGQNPSRFEDADRPVEMVSWDDALGFIRALNDRVSGAFVLPSEAQWEYACRATTMAARYGALDAIAWYPGNAGDQTHPVRQKQPNAWGLYDMLGNVWEWCQDGAAGETDNPEWLGRAYGTEAIVDPVLAPSKKHSCRVVRGGSWLVDAQYVRAAYRSASPRVHRFDYLGFRLARGRAAEP